MAREYEPLVGQWYESVDDNENFRVRSVDEDAELVEIEYLDGDIEEMDLDAWQELDLELIATPEGWSGEDDDDEDEDDWDEYDDEEDGEGEDDADEYDKEDEDGDDWDDTGSGESY